MLLSCISQLTKFKTGGVVSRLLIFYKMSYVYYGLRLSRKKKHIQCIYENSKTDMKHNPKFDPKCMQRKKVLAVK